MNKIKPFVLLDYIDTSNYKKIKTDDEFLSYIDGTYFIVLYKNGNWANYCEHKYMVRRKLGNGLHDGNTKKLLNISFIYNKNCTIDVWLYKRDIHVKL